MINDTEKESLLSSNVGIAIAANIRNPFDKNVCHNCKMCSSKGEIKNYCGNWRRAVASDGSCSDFKAK